MNDQYLMENYLLLLKSNMEVYTHGTLESYNDNVRNTLFLCLQDTISSQGSTFNLMSEYGYYDVTNIACKEIKKSIKKLTK